MGLIEDGGWESVGWLNEDEEETVEIRAGDGTKWTFKTGGVVKSGKKMYPATFDGTRIVWNSEPVSWEVEPAVFNDPEKARVFKNVGTMKRQGNSTRGSFHVPCGCGVAFALNTVVLDTDGIAEFFLVHRGIERYWDTQEPTIEQLLRAIVEMTEELSGPCKPFWEE